MTGAHRRPQPAGHRAPVPAGPRRRRTALAVVLLLLLAGGGIWYRWFYEPPPDVRSAGPGYWVSTKGVDTATGGPGDPWRTIQHAITAAKAKSKIFVRDGEYDPFTVDKPDLTVMSAPGERATVVGKPGVRDVVLVAANGVTVADLTVRGCVPKPNPDVNITGDHGSGVRVHKVSKVTVSGMIVQDSHGTTAAGLPVGCHGILVTESQDVHVTRNEVFHNGAGIGVTRGGRGVLVDDNDVHDQDRIIQNTAALNDDFGGYGLSATFVGDSPGPVFQDNTVRRNHGQSSDYGVDGGGMELYDADNVTVTGNTFETNDGVMETGTSGKSACSGTVFSNNKAVGGNGFDNDTGLVLRCATGMVISGNTFGNLAKFTFLLQTGGDFGGKIDDLKITGNTVTRDQGTVVYRLQYAGPAPTGVQVDKNTYDTGRTGFAILDGTKSEAAVSFDDWRTRTGFDAGSTVVK